MAASVRCDTKVKVEGVDALEKRFIGGDPTIEIELERAVRSGIAKGGFWSGGISDWSHGSSLVGR